MTRPRMVFVCRSCGSAQPRWLGKCPDCGSWDSLEEATDAGDDPARLIASALRAGDEPAEPARSMGELAAAEPEARLATGIGELDRVLGGGLVAGSAVLFGGPPGIGKSTLLLQAAGELAGRGAAVLYVSTEESGPQVRRRADRLGLGAGSAGADRLFVLSETSLPRIFEQARRVGPAVMVVDSVQMIGGPDAGGGVAQLRRCTAELVRVAKVSGVAMLLVGHVTKDGRLAGPRVVEHMVDAVISFEGDRSHALRLVRASKNRFGGTAEIGLFEMTPAGLAPRPGGPGLAAGASDTPRPGSVVTPVMAGSRCLLVEVQALTATGFLGAAKRKVSGLDSNRAAMLVAVLEQHAGLRLADRDIFASAVGGVRVLDPAADLAVLLAIAGAHHRRALPAGTAVIGEVGLGGEVRPVGHAGQRATEAARLGFARLIVPAGFDPGLGRDAGPGVGRRSGPELIPAPTIDAALERLETPGG